MNDIPEIIFDDTRPIQSVSTIGETGEFWAVGSDGVTKIVPYREAGQGAYVTWLAVYKGDYIVYRVNCAAIEFIGYDV